MSRGVQTGTPRSARGAVTEAGAAGDSDALRVGLFWGPSIIHRRVTGGVRLQLGADVSAILTSLPTTARKRGENLFRALRTVAGPSPLDACSRPAFVGTSTE